MTSPLLAAVNVSVVLENNTSSTQTNLPYTFGHVFKAGELAANQTVGAKMNGSDIPVQVDKKATHSDGSLRHAIITVRPTSISANSSVTVTLYSKSSISAAAGVTLQQIRASNPDTVISLDIGGTIYTASSSDLLANTTPTQWLSGPEVSEWLVSGPLKNSQGGTHPLLSARFNVRAFTSTNSVRVSAVLENSWTYSVTPGNVSYDVIVEMAGTPVYSKLNVTHYHHARWRKTFWSGVTPKVNVIHDINYLKSTGAIPNYNPSIRVPESALSNLYSQYTSSNTDIMGIGFINPYMPNTGGRPDIGPLPNWTVLHLLSMDERAWEVSKGIGDLAGSWSIHYRDKNTDLPVSLTDYPNLTTHQNVITSPENPLRNCNPCSTPYTDDESHQPAMTFVPYLLTGDYYLLEELQFWANQNSFRTGASYRGYEKGLYVWDQLRGQAWSLRTLGHTAYITPDNHPMKTYFTNMLNENINFYVTNYTNGGREMNNLGAIVNGYSVSQNNNTGMRTWMADYFVWSIGNLVDLGYTSAVPVRDYVSIFPVGRLTAPGHCWIDGATYTSILRTSGSSPIFSTFAEMYVASGSSNYTSLTCNSPQMAAAKNTIQGDMGGYSSSPEGFAAIAHAAMAVAVDSKIANSAQAWAQLMSRTIKPDFNSYPIWDIVPRSQKKMTPPTNVQITIQ